MEHPWNDSGEGKQRNQEKRLPHCYSLDYKSTWTYLITEVNRMTNKCTQQRNDRLDTTDMCNIDKKADKVI